MTETTKPPAGGFEGARRDAFQREAVSSSLRSQLSIIRFS